MKRVLVTGANGFIGKHLCNTLQRTGIEVWGTARRSSSDINSLPVSRPIWVGDINGSTYWETAFDGVEAVVHLAGRAHVLRESGTDPTAEIRRINVEGTLGLARNAVKSGVRRFVYISSIGVNGNSSDKSPFQPSDVPHPHSAYALSKWEAEKGLWELCKNQSDMEVTVIRPPLVYGPGVKANFLRLLEVIYNRIPLPFSLVNNKRSLVGVENLCDFISATLSHPAACGQTFFVSDDSDVSTPMLIRKIARLMDRKPRLLPIPVPVMLAGMKILRRKHLFYSLCSSLVVDISESKSILNWKPARTLDDELYETVKWYLEIMRRR